MFDPCTPDALEHGCTCRMPGYVSSAAMDPPEPETAADCPLHGWATDPDVALQELRDAEIDDATNG